MSLPLEIHYRRLPDRIQVYRQELLLDAPDVKISYQPSTPLERPLVVAGRVILEPGSPVVWCTFPDRWHDIGRFHRANGEFTGWYANVLTPVQLHSDGELPLRWSTMDLCLDVWQAADGTVEVLDREEFDQALSEGWIDAMVGRRAEREAARLAAAARRGLWPPTVAQEWTLERARQASSSTIQAEQSRSTST